MNFKLLGALLVITACGGCGFLIAYRYMVRIRVLDNFLLVLDFMISDLQYRNTPLPQLCRRASERCNGKVRQILMELADELDAQISHDVGCCMASVLDRLGSLEVITYSEMMEFGNKLGLFDLPGQVQGLERCREHCILKLEMMNRDKASRLRSYQTLGLCTGAAIVILFV